MRYVKNNFLDGPRQDAYDLVTGTWQPRRSRDVSIGGSGGASDDVGDWLRDKRDLVARSAPWVVLASLVTLFFIVMFPSFLSREFPIPSKSGRTSPDTDQSVSRAEYVASLKKLALFSIVLLAVSTHNILNNGIDYVVHPRLMKSSLDDVLNYSGKGYELVPKTFPPFPLSLFYDQY